MQLKTLKIVLFVFLSMLYCKAFAQDQADIIKQLQNEVPNQGKVTVMQSEGITKLVNTYYIKNASRPGMQGFRIRLFFDLGQNSRTASEEVMNEFMLNYPGIAVYRSFDSPYYKVSIGDYRTRDEALKFFKTIEKKYPKAFIVPEWINFPGLE